MRKALKDKVLNLIGAVLALSLMIAFSQGFYSQEFVLVVSLGAVFVVVYWVVSFRAIVWEEKLIRKEFPPKK